MVAWKTGAAVLIQAQLKAVGVQMEIEQMTEEALLSRLAGGQFDAVLARFGRAGGNCEPPCRTEGTIRVFGPRGNGGYDNPRVVELLETINRAVNPNEVDQAFRALSPILTADLPATLLGGIVWTAVAHRRVRGLSSPYHASALRYLDDLWLASDRQ